MKYSVIEAPAFPLQALLRMEPQLAAGPAAITEGEGRRARIAHSNAIAGASGVVAGMSCVQALAECAGLEMRLPSLAAEKDAAAVLLTAAWSIAPSAEETGPGVCTVDLTGRAFSTLRDDTARVRLHLHAQGLDVRIGVAGTPLTARFAAFVAAPEKWVPDECEFLAPLPVTLLGITAEERQMFSTLGIKTLGQMTKMPLGAMTRRLGARGEQLWRMASGETTRPLNLATPPRQFFAQMDLEHPAATLEPLLFVLRRFCDRLAGELQVSGLAAESLRLALRLENDATHERGIRFPEPAARGDVLFNALENHLATVQTDAAVVAVELGIRPARPQHRQDGLFENSLKNPHMFFDTLAQSGAVLGGENIGTPVLAGTHRPDAISLAAPPASVPEMKPVAHPPEFGPVLRRFRPPLRASVETSAQKAPCLVMSERVTGAVADWRGPFRSSGDWWDRGGWRREEWDVELAPGGLYRLARLPDGWRIEGVYD